ncbi:MAG: hypothetical protein NTU41_05075 [Chloroflexi bacterium]|nr:hypothetical protein [Chloroflexota bacterium]
MVSEPSWYAGLIVVGEIVCDGCGRLMRHPERYGYFSDEGAEPRRLCTECARAAGYVKRKTDEKGRESESFI